MNKIGFIGGGKIAQAMAKGFIKAGKSEFRMKMVLLLLEPDPICVRAPCAQLRSLNKLNFATLSTITAERRTYRTHFVHSIALQFMRMHHVLVFLA